MEGSRILRDASSKQGGDRYPGIDTYESIRLEKGTKICALVAYFEDGVMKPNEFFFPQKAVSIADGKAKKLCEGLQISPWRNPQNGKYLYKNRVATFTVIQDFETEYSPKTSENSCYGEGGIIQYHIPLDKAKKYLKKEADDTLLTDEEITEDEYELIMEKREQILLKRNLFSYLKQKVDTLDIIQNTQDDKLLNEALRNLDTINLHIDNLIMDLAFSQEQIGDIVSMKYDKMIALLLDELEIREQEDTLLISNVNIGKELEELSHTITETTDFNLITSHSLNIVESIEKNLTTKIVESERKMRRGEMPDIDIGKQRLHDIINIHRFNLQCFSNIEDNGVKRRDFLPITKLIMQNKNGEKREYKIEEFFTNSSVAEMKGTYNGEMTPALCHKESGTLMKFLMRGNKPQLYIGQSKEKLPLLLDHLCLDASQKETLLSGKEIMINHKPYHIDSDLNTLVPHIAMSKEYYNKKQPTQKKQRHRHSM